MCPYAVTKSSLLICSTALNQLIVLLLIKGDANGGDKAKIDVRCNSNEVLSPVSS